MVSPIIIISIIILIAVVIGLVSYVSPGKNSCNNSPGKKEPQERESLFRDEKPILNNYGALPKQPGINAVCKTCGGIKKIKCKTCHGFRTIKTTRIGPPTTVQVSKYRTVFDTKGRATQQHYMDTQVKPGKTEFVNQTCSRCLGSGKMKCPDC